MKATLRLSMVHLWLKFPKMYLNSAWLGSYRIKWALPQTMGHHCCQWVKGAWGLCCSLNYLPSTSKSKGLKNVHFKAILEWESWFIQIFCSKLMALPFRGKKSKSTRKWLWSFKHGDYQRGSCKEIAAYTSTPAAYSKINHAIPLWTSPWNQSIKVGRR